jgi:hypothetical protein
MAVKISKLFKDTKFQNLSLKTRLLYIYLSTNPNLNTVGIFSPNPEVIALELKYTMEELRESTTTLIEQKYLYVKQIKGVIYFIIPHHFDTIPKSEASVLKIQKIFSGLPKQLVDFLQSINISITSKVKEFIEPTAEEVVTYSLSMGYSINGDDFINYYKSQAEKFGKVGVWVDGRGKQVNDWKGKLRKVWFKEDRKLVAQKNAPKGYEFFNVVKNGETIQPDGWRNGKPFSKSVALDILLKKEYEKRKTNS